MRLLKKMIVSAALMTGPLLHSPSAFCDDQGKFVGTWKLVSSFIEDVENKARDYIEGESAEGYLRFAPTGQFFGFATADIRKLSDQRGLNAISRSIVAYSGSYPPEGGNFNAQVDFAWEEEWPRAEQVRFYRLDGDRHLIETFPIRYPNAFGSMMIGVRIWDRE